MASPLWMWLVAFHVQFFACGALKARPSSPGQKEVQGLNPLLSELYLPPLAKIQPDDVKPAVLLRLQEAQSMFEDLEISLTEKLKQGSSVTYEDVMPQLEEIYDRQGQPWTYFSHLLSTRNSPPLREIEEELQPTMVSFGLHISQSKPVYQALAKINSSAAFASLPEARQRAVRAELMDRKLSGVALEGSAAEEFNKLQTELSELSTKFSNHVLDAKSAWNITLHSKDAVKGMPSRALEAAAAAAKKAGFKDASGEKGPWVLTLDDPVIGPVLSYAENRSLREQMFRADSTLASSGPFDNTEIVKRILKLRQRKAELLGFDNFDALSLASKMARRQKAVTDLLEQVRSAATPAAKREDDELRSFADAKLANEELQKWDIGFYAQKLLKADYDIDREALRPYFAYEAVLDGLQILTQRLFDVSLEATAEGDEVAEDMRTSPTVHVYKVTAAKKTMGYIMVDPYSRPGEKREGAWMMPLVTRRLMPGGSMRLPVAAVVTNFPQPQGGKPSLLSLDEVSTLFHETGHALQVVLTKQTESSVSGTSGIEWDAVEIASQFMEYWVNYDRTTLFSMAHHYETGKRLPEEVYQKLLRAKNFRSATMLLGQVYMAMTDMRLHQGYKDGEDPDKIVKAVGKEVLIHPPLPEARMLCSFGHIFDGGYAAGYYSYLWSDVLSADAFMAFDAAAKLTSGVPQATDDKSSDASSGGLSRLEVLGRKWASTFLAEGGGRDPASVFEDFRGRSPSASALLHYSGLD